MSDVPTFYSPETLFRFRIVSVVDALVIQGHGAEAAVRLAAAGAGCQAVALEQRRARAACGQVQRSGAAGKTAADHQRVVAPAQRLAPRGRRSAQPEEATAR